MDKNTKILFGVMFIGLIYQEYTTTKIIIQLNKINNYLYQKSVDETFVSIVENYDE